MVDLKENLDSPVTQAEYYLPLLQAIMREATPNRWRFLSKEQAKEEMNQIIDEYWSTQEAVWPYSIQDDDDEDEEEDDWEGEEWEDD